VRVASSRSRCYAAGALALALLAGCAGQGGRREEAQAASAPPATTARGADAVRDFRSVREREPTPDPVRISIPRIGVTSSLDRLGYGPHRTVKVPDRWEVAGWYVHGPRPGALGSAVILGHVDSTNGPAVFFRLRELRRGDRIDVGRADGSTLRFVVERTEQHLKKEFPTDEVYYPTLTPALRLVTCGGEFDSSVGHYRSNLIVFAKLQR
jgi:sortase (surface protein transpeptidase)